MASTLYIASPADPSFPLGPSTKLVDLNALATTPASPGFGLLGDPDFGSIDTEAEWAVQPPTPGATQIQRHHPVSTMTLRLMCRDTSTDGMLGQLHALAQALDPRSSGMYGPAMGVIVWQPSGAAEPRYIDFYPSPIRAMLRGQQLGLRKITQLFQDPDGYPLTIWRHPYLRGPILTAAPNYIYNSTLLEDANGNGRPDRWFWDSQTGISAEMIRWTGSVKAYQFALATGNTRKLVQGNTTPVDTPYGVTLAFPPGAVLSGSFYASATGGVVATCIIEFLNAAGAVLATATGTGVTLTTTAQRVTVTTSGAPATTTNARITLQFANSTGSSATVTVGDGTGRGVQLESGASVSTFRCGDELVRNDVGPEQPPLTAPGLTPAAAGNVNIGQHFYRVTFVTADGETSTGPSSNTTIVTSAKQVGLGAIPTGSGRVTARKIWRTKAGQADSNANFFLLTTINDNTTTTYTDNTADASLPAGNPSTAALAVPPDQGHLWVFNPGNVPALAQVRVTPESGAKMIAALFGALAASSGYNLADAANGERLSQRVVDGTLYTDTTALGGIADASGGTLAHTQAGSTAHVRRWGLSITPNDPNALAPGTYQVWCQVALADTLAAASPWTVQMRYGVLPGESPVPFSGEALTLVTPTPITGFPTQLHALYLGTVQIPATAQGLQLEGWAGFPAAGAGIYWDTIELVPVDEDVALVVSPGFRSDGFAQDVWLGARNNEATTDFVNPSLPGGTALPTNYKGSQLILATLNDAAGTPPSGGVVLPPGRHVFTAHGSLYDTSQAGTNLGDLRIYDVTAGGAAVATVSLVSKKKQTWTSFGDPGSTVVAQAVVDVPSGNTHFYQAEIVFTHATVTGMKLYLSDITHEFIPAFDNMITMGLDSDTQLARTFTGSLPTDPLSAPMGFLELPAGLTLLTADFWDLFGLGYDALDPRAPMGRHVANRSASLAVNVIPRYAPH